MMHSKHLTYTFIHLNPMWVDVPTGWAYGWPKLYDPEKDGDLLEWIHRMGYKGTLAGVRSWYQEEEKKDE